MERFFVDFLKVQVLPHLQRKSLLKDLVKEENRDWILYGKACYLKGLYDFNEGLNLQKIKEHKKAFLSFSVTSVKSTRYASR